MSCWPLNLKIALLLHQSCRQHKPRSKGVDKRRHGAPVRGLYFRDSPLNELARKSPSEVMSRYSTSATKVGSTHVALGFLMGLVSFDWRLTTVSSCFLIWLETVRDHPVPTLPR